jgi:hypothetical protein
VAGVICHQVVLIEGFLHYDPGNGKAAQATVTTGTTEYDPDTSPLAHSAAALTPAPAMTAEDLTYWPSKSTGNFNYTCS